MKYEKSCGAVIFARVGGEIQYLLVANLEGIFGFPKGHVEGDEAEAQTATREVFEETHLRIELIDGFRATDEHIIPYREDTLKRIVYFLGEFDPEDEISYPREEISAVRLVNYSTATELFQYESSKRILHRANEFIDRHLNK